MSAVYSLPIPLSRAAFDVLTSEEDRPMPKAKDPSIPHMTFQKSDCGLYHFFMDERVCVIIVHAVAGVHPGMILTCFYGGVLSNFPRVLDAEWTINGKLVAFKDAEQAFKAACVCGHMDAADETSPKALNLLKVLNTVMSAESPRECKRATDGIPREEFDSVMWDDLSPEVMFQAQLWKFKDSAYYNFVQVVAKEALSRDIPMDRCLFFEAAGKDDMRWGAGLTVREMFDAVTTNLANPAWHFSDLSWDAKPPFPGTNWLGGSLNSAFLTAVGGNGERIGWTVEQYRELVGSDFPVFGYTPSCDVEQGDLKRARTEPDSRANSQDALRTSSDSDCDERCPPALVGRTCSQ